MIRKIFQRSHMAKKSNEFAGDMLPMSKYEQAALMLEQMPYGVTIKTLDPTRKYIKKNRQGGFKYSAQYKLGKQVYGNSLLEVIEKLQKQHSNELIPF